MPIVAGSTALASDILNLRVFGGTGADGALAISGTTVQTISVGNAPVFILNYTSVSITGSASLAFSNPATNGTIIIIKSQAGVTITSNATTVVTLINMGPSVGAYGISNQFQKIPVGGNGVSASTGAGGTGGAAPFSLVPVSLAGKSLLLGVGAPGGNGGNAAGGAGGGGGGASVVNSGSNGNNGSSGSTGTPGTGGQGGGSLYIECRGALNITSTLSAAGTAGTNASGGTGGAAGGGGGGGGSIVVVYGTLTANSGTYTVTGGAGGLGANSPTGAAGGTGATGYSLVIADTEFY